VATWVIYSKEELLTVLVRGLAEAEQLARPDTGLFNSI
jgi:hypothetical protein